MNEQGLLHMYTFIIKIVRRGIRPDTSLPVIRLQARDHQEALDSAALLVGAWVETPLVVTADKYLIAHTVECQSLHLYGVTFDITIIVE